MANSCQDLLESCKELEGSCRELQDSYATMTTLAAQLLASWERFKVQQTAATSSPTTTTTPPPTPTTPPPTWPPQATPTPEEAPASYSIPTMSAVAPHTATAVILQLSSWCSTLGVAHDAVGIDDKVTLPAKPRHAETTMGQFLVEPATVEAWPAIASQFWVKLVPAPARPLVHPRQGPPKNPVPAGDCDSHCFDDDNGRYIGRCLPDNLSSLSPRGYKTMRLIELQHFGVTNIGNRWDLVVFETDDSVLRICAMPTTQTEVTIFSASALHCPVTWDIPWDPGAIAKNSLVTGIIVASKACDGLKNSTADAIHSITAFFLPHKISELVSSRPPWPPPNCSKRNAFSRLNNGCQSMHSMMNNFLLWRHIDFILKEVGVFAIQVQSMTAILVRPWDPGVVDLFFMNIFLDKEFCAPSDTIHTQLWCCCQLHRGPEPNATYGCDLLEQSGCSSYWQLKFWTHVFSEVAYQIIISLAYPCAPMYAAIHLQVQLEAHLFLDKLKCFLCEILLIDESWRCMCIELLTVHWPQPIHESFSWAREEKTSCKGIVNTDPYILLEEMKLLNTLRNWQFLIQEKFHRSGLCYTRCTGFLHLDSALNSYELNGKAVQPVLLAQFAGGYPFFLDMARSRWELSWHIFITVGQSNVVLLGDPCDGGCRAYYNLLSSVLTVMSKCNSWDSWTARINVNSHDVDSAVQHTKLLSVQHLLHCFVRDCLLTNLPLTASVVTYSIVTTSVWQSEQLAECVSYNRSSGMLHFLPLQVLSNCAACFVDTTAPARYSRTMSILRLLPLEELPLFWDPGGGDAARNNQAPVADANVQDKNAYCSADQLWTICWKTWDPGGICRTSFAAILCIGLKQTNCDEELGNYLPYIQDCSFIICRSSYKVLCEIEVEPLKASCF